MASKRKFRHQDIAVPAAGTKVRTVHAGKHELRIAFPKGARRKGSGKVVSILHPLTEKNPECGATLSLEEIARLDVPILLTDEFGPAFEGTLDPDIAGQNPAGWKEKWEALRAKVAAFIAPKASGANNPKRGQRKNVKRKKNYTEQVTTSTGKTLFIDVVESRGRWMAEAYPVIGGRVKHVGKPKIAYGSSESDAYDNLIEKIEPNPKKRAAVKRGKSKKNLDEIKEAADLAARFKGSPAENVREIDISNKAPDDYGHLGWVDQEVFHPAYDHTEVDLPEISKDYHRIYVKTGKTVDAWREVAAKHGIVLLVFDMTGDEIELAGVPHSNQLYFLGGNQASFQNLLGDFKTDIDRDKVDLGEMVSVTYTAQKAQAGDTEPSGYYHVFGEQHGDAPRAYYDMLNKRVFLVGGSYHLKQPEDGIIN